MGPATISFDSDNAHQLPAASAVLDIASEHEYPRVLSRLSGPGAEKAAHKLRAGQRSLANTRKQSMDAQAYKKKKGPT